MYRIVYQRVGSDVAEFSQKLEYATLDKFRFMIVRFLLAQSAGVRR